MPWYLATYKYVQLQLNQFGFVCLFNFHTIQQENKCSPCHRIDFLCVLAKWELKSIDGEPDVQQVWDIRKHEDGQQKCFFLFSPHPTAISEQ